MYGVAGPTWELCHVQSAWIYEPGQQVDYMSNFTVHCITRFCILFLGNTVEMRLLHLLTSRRAPSIMPDIEAY
jgi:hypothetical protein